LLRAGLLKVMCRDGYVLALSPSLYAALLRAMSVGIVDELRCGEGIAMVAHHAVSLHESSAEVSLRALAYGWRYDVSCGCWVKGSARFKHMYGPVFQVFEGGEYEFVDIRGKDVVDVGAFVGDSAIYFALRGARRVVAVEPHPEAFKEMIENIKLNSLEGKVIPINAGLASKPGKLCIEGSDIGDTIGSYHKPCECRGSPVPATTLSEIMNTYGVAEGSAVLKMDCEGCEYDVILNDYEHVRLFDEVYFEYHAYATGIPVDVLLKKLSKDFTCQVVSNREFYRSHGYGKKLLGLVKCVKK